MNLAFGKNSNSLRFFKKSDLEFLRKSFKCSSLEEYNKNCSSAE